MDLHFERAENSPEVSGDAALTTSLSLSFVLSARGIPPRCLAAVIARMLEKCYTR